MSTTDQTFELPLLPGRWQFWAKADRGYVWVVPASGNDTQVMLVEMLARNLVIEGDYVRVPERFLATRPGSAASQPKLF